VLKKRGADVAYIYLPGGEGGAKVGLDDYIAQGYEVDDILAHASSELRPPPADVNDVKNVSESHPYNATSRGIVWVKDTPNGPVETLVTNFSARIVGSLLEDDGAEVSSSFEIEAQLAGRTFRFPVSAAGFSSMAWVPANMGPGAVVFPGFGLRDHARAAIQLLSTDFAERRVYRHTGWRRLESGEWAYLHAGGAVLPASCEEAVQVDVQLPDSLSRMTLPEPAEGEQLHEAYRALLRLWGLGPAKITIPLAAAALRAALGGADFALALAGPTGVFKSELAALAQQHFGADFDARHLPASWSGTANSIEGLAFTAKDMLLVVDDYAPQGTAVDVHRLNALVDRIVRAQGNHSGRSRMRADGSLRPTKPPRGLILSTGEDTPPGKSLLGRLLVLDIQKGDISPSRLSACQADARRGLYAQTMSSFLAWIAEDYEGHAQQLREQVIALRDASLTKQGLHGHSRSPEITANLAAAIDLFLRFGEARGILEARERTALRKSAWAALASAEADQADYQRQSNPARRFLSLLRTALTSGRCHLMGADGLAPKDSEAYGWRIASGGAYSSLEERPKGDLVGWVGEADGERRNVWLLPDAALAVVKRLAQDTHESFAVSRIALGKELNAQRLLLTTAQDSARPTLTVRRKFGDKSQDVWHTFFAEGQDLMGEKNYDKVDIEAPATAGNWPNGAAARVDRLASSRPLMSTSGRASRPPGPKS
jgi:hypothetical protein